MEELGATSLMRRAMELAELGKGRTSPNPVVGALVTQDGKVLAEGHHAVLGGLHAERAALEAAGTAAYGSTLISTLEPCRTFGRTPPCTEAIIDAGVAKVIVGSIDPNPKVCGQSVRYLRERGIQVEIGTLASEIAEQNEAYFKYISSGLPFVYLKAAMSMDGKLSLRKGIPTGLTGKEIKADMHVMRSSTDAILVGVETILSDNPRLSARIEGSVARQPARVILDSRCRTPLNSAVVATAEDTLTIVATTDQALPERIQELSDRGVVVVVLDGGPMGIDLEQLLAQLGDKSISSLIVEGGPSVHTSFVRQGLADKYVLLCAPYLIGGDEAPNMIGGESIARLSEAVRLRFTSSKIVGVDLLVEAYPASYDPEMSQWAILTEELAAHNQDVGDIISPETTVEIELTSTDGERD